MIKMLIAYFNAYMDFIKHALPKDNALEKGVSGNGLWHIKLEKIYNFAIIETCEDESS